jgi:hypothetical protein
MRIRRARHISVALVCLLLPLAIVAASGAHVRRRTVAATYVQPKPSIFGIDTGTFDLASGYYAKDFVRAKNLGARWVHFTGDSIHWSNGSPDWSALDYAIAQSKQEKLGIVLSLGGDPNACSVSKKPADFTNCPPTTAADFTAYKKFLKQELLRYRSSVTYYESWVEPNHAGRWPPNPNPTQYAALLKVQYGVFQSVNKADGLHLKLLFGGSSGFGTAPGSSGGMAVLPFTDQVLTNLGGAKAFDGIALHAYRFPPVPPTQAASDNVQGIPAAPGASGPYPKQGCTTTETWCSMTWPQELSAYEQEFLNHGYGANGVERLWLTEFGWTGSSSVPSGQDPSYYPTYAQQKQDLTEAYNDLLGLPFVQGALWFNLRDYDPNYPKCGAGVSGPCDPDPQYFGYFGLLKYDATAKPAGSAFTALAKAHPSR